MTRKPGGDPSPREAGLRSLAASAPGRVESTLQHALQEHLPANRSRKSDALRRLLDGVGVSMPRSTTIDQRAAAMWRLIKDEVERIPTLEERVALTAAMHLDPSNSEPTIDKRLLRARDRGDFETQPSGKPFGYDALRTWWGDGVRILGRNVHERLDYLTDHPADWREYFNDESRPQYRPPSRGAQPVFVELFVTTVFMKGRFVHRRITERLVTARRDNVRFYTARALPENDDASSSVPVRPLWGCKASRVLVSPGEPVLTRLWFPSPLKEGERHFLTSEVMAGDVVGTARRAINVEVDHYGIAPGRRENTIPVSGLTIRVVFDESDLPESCWWYAEVTERERYVSPKSNENRWLPITPQGMVEHTFAMPCQPLANYGVSFRWPQ